MRKKSTIGLILSLRVKLTETEVYLAQKLLLRWIRILHFRYVELKMTSYSCAMRNISMPGAERLCSKVCFFACLQMFYVKR